MKNKKLTYFVLVPAVLIIWGIIVYKLTIKDDEQVMYEMPSNNPLTGKTKSDRESYELINDYNDPFFSEYAQSTDEEFTDEITVTEKPKVNKWPVIRFNGYILNGTKARCHMTINGDDKILQLNDHVLTDYIVLSITSDSVQISCQGISKWFKNNKQ